MPHGQTVADGGTIVEDIHRELRQPYLFRELIDYLGQMIKRVFKLLTAWRFRLSKAREVGGNQMELISQLRHQLAVHVAATGESVQQQDGRLVFRTCLTIKDFNLRLTFLTLGRVQTCLTLFSLNRNVTVINLDLVVSNLCHISKF